MSNKVFHSYIQRVFSRFHEGMKMKAVLISMAVMLAAWPVAARAALTAEQVAQKAASVVADAKGLDVAFTLTVKGKTEKGSVKSAGQKFCVTLPDVTTWYNGRDLYTYNPRIGETTVSAPTAQELLDTNPLLYVRGGGSAYSYSFSPVRRNGKYVVDLTPRNSKNAVRKLTFTINSTTFKTERIVVTTSGGAATIEITSFIVGSPAPASTFEYPAKRYPNVEIIDLR